MASDGTWTYRECNYYYYFPSHVPVIGTNDITNDSFFPLDFNAVIDFLKWLNLPP